LPGFADLIDVTASVEPAAVGIERSSSVYMIKKWFMPGWRRIRKLSLHSRTFHRGFPREALRGQFLRRRTCVGYSTHI